MNKKQEENICNWLDERYELYIVKKDKADWTYYRGLVDMLFACGYEWERDEKGKHIIYKM